MTEKIKACIFDLDGVIVDTATYHYQSWKKLCKTFGFDFKEADNEPLKGASRMHSLEIILELAGMQKSQAEKALLCEQKNNWYLESIQQMTAAEILPGVEDLLSEMQQEGISIALGSASKNARTILNLIGLNDSFDAIVDGTNVKHGKPDPEVFQLAAQELNVTASHCLVFEDAAKGIEAAHRAGMLAVGIGDQNSLEEADLVIPSLEKHNWSFIESALSQTKP